MQGLPPPPEQLVDRRTGLWGAPQNRWSYQNMRRLWPTAPVSIPGGAPLPTRPIAGVGSLSVPRPEDGAMPFDAYLEASYTDALVVAARGGIAYEAYLNGMAPGAPHIVFSCTKSLVGLLALMALEDGIATRETVLTEIVPELAGSGFEGARLGHLLDMTTALAFDETYADLDADIHGYLAALGAGEGTAPPGLYRYLTGLRRDPDRAHGAVVGYQTPQTDALAWAVSRLLGQDVAQAITERIAGPLGWSDEAYLLLDPLGTPFAGGGLCASARDMARLGLSLLDGGALPERIAAVLREGGPRVAFHAGPEAVGCFAEGWSYAAQWWVRHKPGAEAIAAIGVNGQWLYVDHARGVVVAKQSSQPIASDPALTALNLAAFDAIVGHCS